MSIWNTLDKTEDEIKDIIRDRVNNNLDQMSQSRLVEVLEALVQTRDYDDYTDEYWLNNFWVEKR